MSDVAVGIYSIIILLVLFFNRTGNGLLYGIGRVSSDSLF